MVNNYYQIYLSSVFDLANTLSIKFEQAAEAINNKVMIDYGYDAVDLDDPTSWKYYQNISGSYHFSNKTMEVTSLDTLETIIFNKVVLEDHPATVEAYQYGGRYYKELLYKYPDEEMLIRGILYPCDIDTAVSAKDATILSYPSYLVDSNEYSFITKLQDWIYDYYIRWVNKQYTISHDLYVPMYMVQLYIHLVPAIINIRLQACKTSEAHNFHIRQYLASHGMLDKYLSAMTKNQALFFYRNIDYIEANAGKKEVFDWLVENVMTARGLPLYEYDAKHDVSLMVPTEDNAYSSEDRPGIVFRRLPINYPTVDPKRNTYGLSDIFNKINDQASGNAEYHEDNYTTINNELIDSDSSDIATKLIESSIKDYSDAVPYRLADILLNEWLYMSHSNRFNAYVTIEFPITKEATTIKVKEAFILYTYCMLKVMNVEAGTLPKILANRVYKVVKPTLQWMYDYFAGSHLSKTQIQSVFLNNPPVTPVTSINAFYKRAADVYNLTLRHYYAESNNEHFIETGELKVANSQVFEDRIIQLTSDTGQTLYSDWLDSYSYDFTVYTPQDYLDLATVIYDKATGALANKQMSIKDIQRAMVGLFTRLSSYSIEVISDVNESGIYLVPHGGIKLGDRTDSAASDDMIEFPIITINGNSGQEQSDIAMDVNSLFSSTDITSEENDIVVIDYSAENTITTLIDEYSNTNVEFSPSRITGADFQIDYDSLSTAQKLELFELNL
jgi:hypothetical protein